MKFKKGDRVSVSGTVSNYPANEGSAFISLDGSINPIGKDFNPDSIHPHPGTWEIEHIEAMKRELELVSDSYTAEHVELHVPTSWGNEYLQLRKNRELASKPQFSEGQEVEARGHIRHSGGPFHEISFDHRGDNDYMQAHRNVWVHEDDIRPVEKEDD